MPGNKISRTESQPTNSDPIALDIVDRVQKKEIAKRQERIDLALSIYAVAIILLSQFRLSYAAPTSPTFNDIESFTNGTSTSAGLDRLQIGSFAACGIVIGLAIVAGITAKVVDNIRQIRNNPENHPLLTRRPSADSTINNAE